MLKTPDAAKQPRFVTTKWISKRTRLGTDTRIPISNWPDASCATGFSFQKIDVTGLCPSRSERETVLKGLRRTVNVASPRTASAYLRPYWMIQAKPTGNFMKFASLYGT
jgi:hypothetical protein